MVIGDTGAEILFLFPLEPLVKVVTFGFRDEEGSNKGAAGNDADDDKKGKICLLGVDHHPIGITESPDFFQKKSDKRRKNSNQ